jgi:hypothetical protein
MQIDADTLSKYVTLRNDGALEVQSVLYKIMPRTEAKRLISCVEDNIFQDADGEHINYEGAIRDWKGDGNGK